MELEQCTTCHGGKWKEKDCDHHPHPYFTSLEEEMWAQKLKLRQDLKGKGATHYSRRPTENIPTEKETHRLTAKECQGCPAIFYTIYDRKKYCSSRCSAKYYNAHHKISGPKYNFYYNPDGTIEYS